jgi:L-lysine 2,3-aminomutase
MKVPNWCELFSLLRGAGAELHYIYIPCSPIHGNSVYWSPISKGLAVGNYLRAHLSDRVIPRICTATPIGKMDWHTSGWAVAPVAENENFMWIRSPYTPDYFKQFAPLANELDNIRVNAEGTIDIQYMAQIGDPSLFLGSRPPRPDQTAPPQTELTAAVLPLIRDGEKIAPSIVPTGSTTLSRVHLTRVEIDTQCTQKDLDYIRKEVKVTDVVIVSSTDAVDAFSRIRRIVGSLDQAPHVNAVRLRSLKFNYEPERLTAGFIDALAGLNRLTMADPLRLEIETQFLVADEIRPEHARLARQLNNRGITVYCNTPLLGRINDTPQAIHQLAYACRRAGIEFHHLYVAGLPIQNRWNLEKPVALYDVIDIATKVRREGSGREIPSYIIRTVLGEVDFGLSSMIVGQDADLSVKLLPYDFVSRSQGQLYIRVPGKRRQRKIAYVFRQRMGGQPFELLNPAQAVQHAAVPGRTFSREETGNPVVVSRLRIAIRQWGTIDGAGYAQDRTDATGQHRMGCQKMQNIGCSLGIAQENQPLGWPHLVSADRLGDDVGIFITARQAADMDDSDVIPYLPESFGDLPVGCSDILKTIVKGARYDQNIQTGIVIRKDFIHGDRLGFIV